MSRNAKNSIYRTHGWKVTTIKGNHAVYPRVRWIGTWHACHELLVQERDFSEPESSSHKYNGRAGRESGHLEYVSSRNVEKYVNKKHGLDEARIDNLIKFMEEWIPCNRFLHRHQRCMWCTTVSLMRESKETKEHILKCTDTTAGQYHGVNLQEMFDKLH